VLAGVLMFGCSPGVSPQDKGKPDQSVTEARKYPPFPPKGVSVKSAGKRTVVTWDPIPLDNVVGYRVYRKVGDEPFTRIGTAEHPPFVDEHTPHGQVSYTITAINSYQAESSFATSAKR
jgi:hypothetical protein